MRLNAYIQDVTGGAFQFTHPGRGATAIVIERPALLDGFNSRTPGGVRPPASASLRSRRGCFNSRTPGGVRRVPQSASQTLLRVSIHAPREGCDQAGLSLVRISREFQFTHPGRGATVCRERGHRLNQVSIHAPREGCDFATAYCVHTLACFNSRTPGGVRRSLPPILYSSSLFQFTHPGRGATYRRCLYYSIR